MVDAKLLLAACPEAANVEPPKLPKTSHLYGSLATVPLPDHVEQEPGLPDALARVQAKFGDAVLWVGLVHVTVSLFVLVHSDVFPGVEDAGIPLSAKLPNVAHL